MCRIDAVDVVQVKMHRNEQAGFYFCCEQKSFLCVHIPDDIIAKLIVAAAVDRNHEEIHIFQLLCQTVIDAAVSGMEESDAAERQFVSKLHVISGLIGMKFFVGGRNRKNRAPAETEFASRTSADNPAGSYTVGCDRVLDRFRHDKFYFFIVFCKGAQRVRIGMVKMGMGAQYIINKIKLLRFHRGSVPPHPFYSIGTAVPVYII